MKIDSNDHEILCKKIAAKINELSAAYKRVCDFGFGNFMLIETIASRNDDCLYLGIDKNKIAVEIARKRITELGKNDFFSVELADVFNFSRGGFDCCICSRLFHHFSLNEAKNVFQSMAKIVDMNGRLIIVDSIRDYNNRLDRNSYTPYFFVNEMSALLGAKNIIILPVRDARLNFNQMWFLCIDIHTDKATFELHTLQEE